MEEEKKALPPFYKRKEFLPLLAFVFLISFLLISSHMTGRPPQIVSISPRIGYPGDVMVITGRYFGSSRSGSEVVISGYSPISSDYLEWKDNRISLRIPDDASSGLVHVITRSGRSRGILFTNRAQIPVVLSGPGKPGEPYIVSLSAKSLSIGSLLTLEGMNFGLQRGSSMVTFSWVPADASRKVEEGSSSLIPALEYDQDYESWSDREIQVRIPDGATSGQVRAVTDKGESNSIYLEVEGKTGAKLYPEKRTYSIQYTVEIRNVSATDGNGLYLWVPKVLDSPEQRSIQLVSQDPAPQFEDVHGVKLFWLQNLKPGKSYTVLQNYMLDRYCVETRVYPGKIPGSYDGSRKLFKKYTEADELIPADHPKIKPLGKSIVGGEKNPYLKAKLIFQWLLNRLAPSDSLQDQDVLKTLDTRKANSFTYAALFCALARSVEIPSRPVAGYLIDKDNKPVRHFWAEFYIETIGWIPVDLRLAEGASRVSLAPEINPQSYYFGNLDFSHLTFSKGLVALNQMDPEGRVVRRKDLPTLQTLHEEATGNLFSYSAAWSDIEVLGVY